MKAFRVMKAHLRIPACFLHGQLFPFRFPFRFRHWHFLRCSMLPGSFRRQARSLLAVFLLFSLVPTIASGESSNPTPTPTLSPQKEAEFTSFLNYQLKPIHFQSSFREIIEKIVAGSTPNPQPAALNSALQSLSAREKTESRGRLDVVYFLEGYAWEKLGKQREALAAYGKAVAERSQNPLYVFKHAFLLKQSGKCSQANQEFQQIAWSVQQASHEPLFLAGECLEQLGKKEEAKRLYTEAAKRSPHYIPVLRKVLAESAEALETEYDPKKKTELQTQIRNSLEAIIAQNPNDHDASLQLGELILEGPKSVLSTTTFARVATLAQPFVTSSKSKDERAVLLLFETQKRLGKLSEARSTVEAGLKASPNSEALGRAKKSLELEEQLQEWPDARGDRDARRGGEARAAIEFRRGQAARRDEGVYRRQAAVADDVRQGQAERVHDHVR